jgi:RNA polymerase sigma-70 factor (ECF subfamily)
MEDGHERPSTPDGPEDHAGIYERMGSRMLRLFGHQPWLQDVVQGAFEAFLEKRHTLRDPSRENAFADRIALNHARDEMRRHKRASVVNDIIRTQADWPVLTPTPESVVQDRDRIRRLTVILEKLDPKYRMAYLLYHVQGNTIAEIAEMEGIGEEGVRKRIARARKQIHGRARKDPVLAEWLASMKEGRR